MKYGDVNDYELINMVHESSDTAKDALLDKYYYIIEIELKKYARASKMIGYDYNDLYQDALLGFSDALHCFREDKKTALPSFITLCVDRKLQNSIIKAGRLKNKLINDSLSLEHIYDASSSPLKDLLSDNSLNDPLENIVKAENKEEMARLIKKELSGSEYDVYLLMMNGHKYDEIALILQKDLKQIDNAMQRVKAKIKKIMNEM